MTYNKTIFDSVQITDGGHALAVVRDWPGGKGFIAVSVLTNAQLEVDFRVAVGDAVFHPDQMIITTTGLHEFEWPSGGTIDISAQSAAASANVGTVGLISV